MFQRRFFFKFSHYIISQWKLLVPSAWPVWTPGAWLAGFFRGPLYIPTYQIYKLRASGFQSRKLFFKFSHYKPMGSICYHGNQNSNPISQRPSWNLPLTWSWFIRNLIKIGQLTLEIYFFENVNGRLPMDAGALAYKLGDNCIQNFNLDRYIVGYTVGNLVLRWRASGAVKRDFQTYIRRYTSPNENFEYGYPHFNALLQFDLKSERCKPYRATRHPTKGDVIDDIKLFPTVYRRIYCRKFLTLSNQTSRYKCKCIRIPHLAQLRLAKNASDCWHFKLMSKTNSIQLWMSKKKAL